MEGDGRSSALVGRSQASESDHIDAGSGAATRSAGTHGGRPAPGQAGALAGHGGGAGAHSPQSKEGVVARLFEAFSRRDLATTLTLVHPEIVFQPMTAEVIRGGEPYRGHDGIRRYLQDVEAHWDELTVHPAQIRAAGRAVVVLGLVNGSGPAGSFENAATTWVVKFNGGLVFHAQIFSDARHVVGALVGEND
jgi:ketosteroid isomerase-like protein